MRHAEDLLNTKQERKSIRAVDNRINAHLHRLY